MVSITGADKFQSTHDLDLSKVEPYIDLHTVDDTDVDPVTYEVLQHRLSQLTEEMGHTIKNVSGSVVATDANDFQTTISDELGNLIEIGPYILFFAGVVDPMIKWILEHRSENPGIEEGDMILCNDPWVGMLHQNDVSLLKPVFHEGELFAWVNSTIHQVDVGGTDPGSFVPSASDVFAESIPLPPVKIIESGELREDIEDLYLRRSRNPPKLALDLRAKRAANNLAERRIHEMIEEYGAGTVKRVMKHNTEYTESRFRDRLQRYPDGVWRHENYMEVSEIGDRGVYHTVLEMEIDGDDLTFRVTGDEATGMINCTRSGLYGGVMSAILPLMAYDLPWGLTAYTNATSIEPEPGIVVNADFPSGVSMGTVSGAYHIHDSATMCISKMLAASDEFREDLVAGNCGSWPTQALMGPDHRDRTFSTIFLDMMAGGYGARVFADGVNTAGNPYAIRGQSPTIERNEANMPILYLHRGELTDSGGPGKFRGGVGAAMSWILHDVGGPDVDPEEMTLESTQTAWGAAFPAVNGIAGGMPPNSNLYKAVRDSNVRQRLEDGELPTDIEELGDVDIHSPKNRTQQHGHDVFYVSWGGGGGVGDPLDRDPGAVRDDVINGYVSRSVAENVYGVVLEGDGLDTTVDEPATADEREAIRERRRQNATKVGGE